jgi:hypothetical protein
MRVSSGMFPVLLVSFASFTMMLNARAGSRSWVLISQSFGDCVSEAYAAPSAALPDQVLKALAILVALGFKPKEGGGFDLPSVGVLVPEAALSEYSDEPFVTAFPPGRLSGFIQPRHDFGSAEKTLWMRKALEPDSVVKALGQELHREAVKALSATPVIHPDPAVRKLLVSRFGVKAFPRAMDCD